METRVEKLKTKCSANETIELVTLYNAYVRTLKKINEDQSAANMRNFDVSKKVLTETIGMFEAKYFDDAEPFKDRAAVAAYLAEQGYKVRKSKIYKDADAGLLRVQADKTVRQVDVRDYIILAGLEKVADESGDMTEDVKDKSRAEVALLKAREEKLRFELEREKGKYLLKSDVETETAIKIGAFESQFKNTSRIKSTEWVFAVGGDPKNAKILENLINAEIDARLEEFGKLDELNVVIRKRQRAKINQEEVFENVG